MVRMVCYLSGSVVVCWFSSSIECRLVWKRLISLRICVMLSGDSL